MLSLTSITKNLRLQKSGVRFFTESASKIAIDVELSECFDKIASKNYDEAEDKLQTLVKTFSRRKGEKLYNVLLQLLGDTHYFQRNYLDAEICYRNIVEIIEAYPERFTPEDLGKAYCNALRISAISNINYGQEFLKKIIESGNLERIPNEYKASVNFLGGTNYLLSSQEEHHQKGKELYLKAANITNDEQMIASIIGNLTGHKIYGILEEGKKTEKEQPLFEELKTLLEIQKLPSQKYESRFVENWIERIKTKRFELSDLDKGLAGVVLSYDLLLGLRSYETPFFDSFRGASLDYGTPLSSSLLLLAELLIKFSATRKRGKIILDAVNTQIQEDVHTYDEVVPRAYLLYAQYYLENNSPDEAETYLKKILELKDDPAFNHEVTTALQLLVSQPQDQKQAHRDEIPNSEYVTELKTLEKKAIPWQNKKYFMYVPGSIMMHFDGANEQFEL